MPTVFVSEYLTCGATTDESLSGLLPEGRSMVCAVIEDLLRDRTVNVLTTWRTDVRPPRNRKRLWVEVVGSPDREWAAFTRGVSDSGVQLVVAPETDDILATRIEACAPSTCCNASPSAARHATSKQLLSGQRFGVRTAPPTTPVDPENLPDAWPVIVKPDDGAGCERTFVLRSPAEWHAARDRLSEEGLICSPFIEGTPASFAMIVRSPTEYVVLPPIVQHIDEDSEGNLHYAGGMLTVPYSEPLRKYECNAIAKDVAALAGMRGWAGVDVIFPENGPAVLIDINPRLTTSYLGYRELTDANLALLLTDLAPLTPPEFRSGSVRFFKDGRVERDA